MADLKNNAKSKSDFYHPADSVLEMATVKEYDKLYHYSINQREQFWSEQAEHLSWFKKWDRILDPSDQPFYKWFVGGKINIIHNAIDRHLKT